MPTDVILSFAVPIKFNRYYHNAKVGPKSPYFARGSEGGLVPPELHPKILEYCQHYGFAPLPTRPGRTFEILDQQNSHLVHWEQTVANTLIHGSKKVN